MAKIEFLDESWCKQQLYWDKHHNLLLKIKRELEFRTKRSEERKEQQSNSNHLAKVTHESEILKLKIEITQLEKKIENLGEKGQILKAKLLMPKLERFKLLLLEIENKVIPDKRQNGNINFQRWEICTICGGLQDQRPEKINQHLAGRIHNGFILFQKHRNKVESVLEKHEKERFKDYDSSSSHEKKNLTYSKKYCSQFPKRRRLRRIDSCSNSSQSFK